MTVSSAFLAIDQGTTSSRALLVGTDGRIIDAAQQAFKQYYPHSGWVEHDPQDILRTTLATIRDVLGRHQDLEILAAGMSNQRETTLLWDRKTGEACANAIVWQDRRTADYTETLEASGVASMITQKTGLLCDPYFSGTKIKWLLDNIPGARQRAEKGELAAGTIDSFLIWHLTGGAHLTDITNASRTLLFDINTKTWDPELCRLMDVPMQLLPEVRACDAHFGTIQHDFIPLSIDLYGVAGDQHCAMVGQGCFGSGDVKGTFGTGGFLMQHTGSAPVPSQHRLLSTIAFDVLGVCSYALEGSIFNAGSAVKWLRDGLRAFDSYDELKAILASADEGDVVVVPAFTGLGAPHWRADMRGAIFGLTRDSGVDAIVKATVQSIVFQSVDLFAAMGEDTGVALNDIRIDGGLANCDYFCQFLSDMMALSVEIPASHECSALGAAMIAGLGCGYYTSLAELQALRQVVSCYRPVVSEAARAGHLARWRHALSHFGC